MVRSETPRRRARCGLVSNGAVAGTFALPVAASGHLREECLVQFEQTPRYG